VYMRAQPVIDAASALLASIRHGGDRVRCHAAHSCRGGSRLEDTEKGMVSKRARVERLGAASGHNQWPDVWALAAPSVYCYRHNNIL
jgi:hypothetical protein